MKSITRWITLAALFLIPIFPAIIANSYFFPFITGKAFYFRVLVEVAFAGWLLLCFLDVKYRPKLNKLTVAVTLFTVVVLVADLLGVSPLRSIGSNFERMEGWITIVHLWMFFMAITYTFGSGEEGRVMWHRWFLFSLLVATYVAFYGALQWAGKLSIAQSADRPDSTLGNAAYLAVYLLIHVFVAIYQFVASHERRRSDDLQLHWMYIFLAVFFSAIVYSTATRGAMLGLAGGVILALALYAIFAKHSSKISRSVCGGFIVLIILLGVLVKLNANSPFIAKHPSLNRLASISLTEFKSEGRFYVWPMALKGFTQRPILGWGQENFNYIFNANYNAKMWGQEQWFDRAHSVFFDWLVASGLVGLIIYISLYVLFIVVVWKSDISVASKSILTGLMAAYAVHNLFVFDSLGSYVFFFALLGMATSVLSRNHKEIFGHRMLSVDAVEYVVAPIIIVVLIAGGYFMTVVPVQANTSLISALQMCQSSKPDTKLFQAALDAGSITADQEIREQFLSCATSVLSGKYSNNIKMEFYTMAKQVIKDQIAATPKDARIYTLAGSFWTSLGQYDDAATLLEKAHALSPEKQTIVFDLAMTYISKGKNDVGLALLKHAYESATEYPQARTAYAAALILSNKESDAHVLFGNDPAVFDSTTLAQVYMSQKQYDKAIALFERRIAANKDSLDERLSLAQAQYTAKMNDAAVETLKTAGKDFPEYIEQINAAIKQVQAKK